MDSIWNRIWEHILRKFLLYVVLILLGLIFAMLKYGCVRCIRYCSGDQKQEEGTAGELAAPAPAPYPQQQYAAPYPAAPDYIVPPIPMPWHKHWHDAEAARGAQPRAFSDSIQLLKPLRTTGHASASTPLIQPTGTPYPHPSCQPVVLPPEGAGYPSAPSAPDTNVMPPSYEQAVCVKPPPHNPYASH